MNINENIINKKEIKYSNMSYNEKYIKCFNCTSMNKISSSFCRYCFSNINLNIKPILEHDINISSETYFNILYNDNIDFYINKNNKDVKKNKISNYNYIGLCCLKLNKNY